MARQVRPWPAQPVEVRAPRVRSADRGAGQRIPSGTAGMCPNEVRIHGCNLLSHHRRCAGLGKPGASIHDFSLRASPSPFQARGEISPGKNAILHRTVASFTPPRLDHKSFAVSCPLALLGSASDEVCVPRLTVYAPRFLSTLGRPHAVALHFARCGQLAGGLAPPRSRPCWAHTKKPSEEGFSHKRRAPYIPT
jgi:hypothetical protein